MKVSGGGLIGPPPEISKTTEPIWTEQKPIDWSQRELHVGRPKIQNFRIFGALGGQKPKIFEVYLKGRCARIYGPIFTGQKTIDRYWIGLSHM